ncbi:MAG: hypothetical protein ACKPJ4_10875 [Dolichospermum sp.]
MNTFSLYTNDFHAWTQEPQLEILKQILTENGNPTAFPDTSIFNQNWDDWR